MNELLKRRAILMGDGFDKRPLPVGSYWITEYNNGVNTYKLMHKIYEVNSTTHEIGVAITSVDNEIYSKVIIPNEVIIPKNTAVYNENGVEIFGNNYKYNVVSISVGGNYNNLSYGPFTRDKRITSLIIQEGIKVIAKHTLTMGNNDVGGNLECVIVPSSITYIGDYFIHRRASIKRLKYKGLFVHKLGNLPSADNGLKLRVVVFEGITLNFNYSSCLYINPNGFNDRPTVKRSIKLVLPNITTVAGISSTAFTYTINNNLYDAHTLFVLYVPDNLVVNYRNSSWYTYLKDNSNSNETVYDIIKPLSEYPINDSTYTHYNFEE